MVEAANRAKGIFMVLLFALSSRFCLLIWKRGWGSARDRDNPKIYDLNLSEGNLCSAQFGDSFCSFVVSLAAGLHDKSIVMALTLLYRLEKTQQ